MTVNRLMKLYANKSKNQKVIFLFQYRQKWTVFLIHSGAYQVVHRQEMTPDDDFWCDDEDESFGHLTEEDDNF
jgi:hypothetical protein